VSKQAQAIHQLISSPQSEDEEGEGGEKAGQSDAGPKEDDKVKNWDFNQKKRIYPPN
jgi:hypothetical protein